jgi:hypothetical protein
VAVDKTRELAGKAVAITGRLASMSRAQAIEHIERLHGRYVPVPDARTSLLVIGQDGWPSRRGGAITRSLEVSLQLRARSCPLEIIEESRFLALLGLDGQVDRLLTTTQVSNALGVPPHRVREWVAAGWLTPRRQLGRLMLFDFAQVACARGLSHLRADGVGPERLRRSLRLLQRWFPDRESLPRMISSLESGRELLVRLPDGRLAEPTGQLRLSFEDASGREHGEPLELRRRSRHDPIEAFEEGLRCEDGGDLEEALAAYERAAADLDAEPEVHFNIGNVLCALGRLDESASRFLAALERDPEYVEAWNNLGNVLADLGREDDAMLAYRKALSIDTQYVDAHYNLGETLYGLGRAEEAIPHWNEYLRRDPLSSWGRRALARIQRAQRGRHSRGGVPMTGGDRT